MSGTVVVTGGGTAGHVLPALAVAEALVARGYRPDQIDYVGTTRGIENRLLPETPFPATYLDVMGLQRRLSFDNVRFVTGMWRATRQAARLLNERNTQAVVSVGGYGSMPAVFAARRLKIPIITVSYDFLPGLATKLSARWAVASAVAFPGSTLPRPVVTGAPLRQTILDIDRDAQRDEARQRLGIDRDRFMIAVVGGSQGSGVLNHSVAELCERHSDDHGLAVRHIAGDRFLDETPPARDGSDGLVYQPVGYEADMSTVYAAADLLIARGGASTVHEVAAVGIPAILVPWAGAAENHQALNVDWLASAGAAIDLGESDIARLGEIVDRLRGDDDERARLAAAARQQGALHRDGAIARLIDDVVCGRPVPTTESPDLVS
ncbi:MAG: hypothetical protein CSA55_02815 [Ilumatobacter coccineus]|uniref:UDP-N-acetylglucosamine--N-acetylmuramyl-(pentapeptide) pyrophosphoryl-undecaprenol N-acetylglucosamine transferase n=1 Tax=Ilumatobacter coccineus TaxID=467094 RepID=A0A2G6KB35_9ACTN|nr:MAG: hypothetical protein CSA55_02815 [Ilumatobacter coccineus]